MRHLRLGLLLLVIALFSSMGTAHAYLDPGSGGIFLQVVLGAFAAVAVGVKFYWTQLITFFKGLKK